MLSNMGLVVEEYTKYHRRWACSGHLLQYNKVNGERQGYEDE